MSAGGPPDARDGVVVRDARDEERAAIAALTRAAYAEYAAAMAPDAWAALRDALEAALAREGPDVQRVVAVGVASVGFAAMGTDGAPALPDGSALLGSVQLHAPASDAYAGLAARVAWPELRLLAVAPGARGLGIGRRLVEACARRARAAGAEVLGLHTSASMAAARALYARLGFVRAPAHDFRPDGAELVEGYQLPLVPGADGRAG